MPTKIEWCDETINPIVGCSKCSPGCDNCYAEKFAARLAANPRIGLRALAYQIATERGRWSGKTVYDFSCFHKKPGKGQNIFLCSMGDLFHATVPSSIIDSVFDYMSAWPEHRFLVLTKRAERMRCLVRSLVSRWNSLGPVAGCPAWPLKNVWLGVTVCNQQEAEEKIPLLLDAPAAGRFVSVEPMLGPVDLRSYLGTRKQAYKGDQVSGSLDYEQLLSWVIVGGETGPGARPMHPDWVRSLRDQCQAAGVPFFFKGWGEWLPWGHYGAAGIGDDEEQSRFLAMEWYGHEWKDEGYPQWCDENVLEDTVGRVGRKRSGRLLDGVEHNERPW